MGDKTSASRAHSQLNEAILATRIRKYLPRTYQKANLAQDVDNIIESSKISTETDIEGVFDILCQQSVVVTPMKTELLPAVDYGDVSVATKLNNIKLNNLNKAKRQYDTQSNDQIKAMEKLAREHGEQSGDMTFSINFKSLLAHTKARLRWPSRTIARGQEISKAETPHRPILKRVVDSMVIASGLRDLPAARDASSDLEKLSGSNPTREYLNKIGFIAMEPHRDGPLIHEILGNNRIWSTNSQMFDAIIIRAKDEAQRENAANS
jgi:hypothetical protein